MGNLRPERCPDNVCEKIPCLTELRLNDQGPSLNSGKRGFNQGWADERGFNSGVVILNKVGLIKGMRKPSVVLIDPEIMSGEPCFAGTRVPVRTLLDYLEGGDTIDEFLEDFPTVSRDQAVSLLEEAGELLIAHA